MKEELFHNPVELRTAVPPPHFEDRHVVLRAQPVVPLDEIRTKVRLRRLAFIGGAFVVAIVLGAASALLAIQFKRVAATSQISQIEEQPAPEPAPANPEVDTTAAAQLDLPAETPLVEEAAAVDEPAKPIVTAPKQPEPLAERPRIVNTDRETLNGRAERDSRQPSEEEQLEQIREAVLYERWQERRMRRAARRERRNRGDRDLTRVDEIFEGPRRPERP